MRKKAYLLLITLLFGIGILSAQDINGLTNAFKKGSAGEVAPYLGDQIEFIFMGDAKNYNKAKTNEALTELFAKNKVSNFTINHEGNRGESSFIVGTLTTANGKYRVNCYFKKTGEQYLIHQIRIDKSNE